MEAYKQEKFEVMQRARAYGITMMAGTQAECDTSFFDFTKKLDSFEDMTFKAGAASRDAEVAEYMLERTIRKATEQSNSKLIAERDQLREQVKMLRDALEVTHELYANASSGYGFARPKNPHNFCPDINGCSKEEIAAHSKACDDYSAGRRVADESWGVGTYNDEYAPALEALAATEPNK